jgi:hypothetical protein
MGLAGLTAVFGMGTGVAPPVWSPECGRQAFPPAGRGFVRWFVSRGLVRGSGQKPSEWTLHLERRESSLEVRMREPPGIRPGWRRRIGVVKLLGC